MMRAKTPLALPERKSFEAIAARYRAQLDAGFLDEIGRTTMSLDGRSVIEERTPVAVEA